MSPVAMKFNTASGIHASPASRAAMDAARLKAKAERNSRTPGPGAYDAKVPGGRTENAGAAAFKSSTKRGKDADLAYMGDPGAYDAYASSDLASNAGKSYAKSMQSGTGGFGSSAPARAPLSSVVDAPGPGQYDAKRPSKPEAAQSSAFASKTNRGAYTKTSEAPGVGSYDPPIRADTVLGGQSAFKNGEQRFKKDAAMEAQAHVGPGSYTNTIGTLEHSLSQVKTSSVGFQSTQKRPELAQVTDTPGPGSYSPRITHKGWTGQLQTVAVGQLTELTTPRGSVQMTEGTWSRTVNRSLATVREGPSAVTYTPNIDYSRHVAPKFTMREVGTRSGFINDGPGPQAYTPRPKSRFGDGISYGSEMVGPSIAAKDSSPRYLGKEMSRMYQGMHSPSPAAYTPLEQFGITSYTVSNTSVHAPIYKFGSEVRPCAGPGK